MYTSYYRVDIALFEFIQTEVISRHYFYTQEVLAQGIMEEIRRSKSLRQKLGETPPAFLKQMVEAIIPSYSE